MSAESAGGEDTDGSGTAGPPGPMTTPTGTSGTSTPTTTTTSPPTTADVTSIDSDPSSGSGDTSTSVATIGFIPDTFDSGDGCSFSTSECSVWDQDCCDGEKCSAWANDGGDWWNAVRCSPVEPGAGAPGDPCSVEGSSVSGIDTCLLGAMCWDVDPDTLQGTCVALCEGTENAPTCADPNTACMISNEGVLDLCLPTCDPLASACAKGHGCYLVDDAWLCLPIDAAVESPSGLTPALCEPGETAVPPTQSFCEGDTCCARICDVNAPACAPPLNCVAAIGGSNAGLCVD